MKMLYRIKLSEFYLKISVFFFSGTFNSIKKKIKIQSTMTLKPQNI